MKLASGVSVDSQVVLRFDGGYIDELGRGEVHLFSWFLVLVPKNHDVLPECIITVGAVSKARIVFVTQHCGTTLYDGHRNEY